MERLESTVDTPIGTVPGLTAAQVAERIAAGQLNNAPRSSSRSTGDIVRANVLTRINAIYGTLFAIILTVGPVQDSLFGGLIVVNSAVGIIQELRAKRTLDRLSLIGQSRSRVWRDGELVEIAPEEIVIDDTIDLGPGDQIVVDGVVLGSRALEVDEALLTGEADSLHKQPGEQLLSGSFVVAGTGEYRAVKVGRDAYAARLAEEASRFTLVNSDLRNGIDRILRFIGFLLVPAGALTIYNQLSGDQTLAEALRGMVAALVPMVPEGLILMTSVAFAVGVIRLGQRNCLVQELPAIEGLARVDVVCTDKTGTLTDNGMRLSEVRILPAAEVSPERAAQILAALAAADPRPNASLAAVATRYPDDPGYQVTSVAAFSSARKWSGAGFEGHGSWVLGAPDVLLPPASSVLVEVEPLVEAGKRVLLLGRCAQPVTAPDAPGPVDPVALLVLEQSLRPDAQQTLKYFADQDVVVKVVSGDNPTAVGAVAAALDLPASTPVNARDLPEDPTELADVVERSRVFGRVQPTQKRAMVKALQSRGHVVAMTGDGVNDVLALKDADIGVAMGSGSPASRSVAQIVLLDDRFATLPYVVAEGRRVIGNIERVANLFLTKTVYSVVLALMVGLSGVPYPFLPRHVSIIAWFTIGIPAFFLALAPNAERARPGFVPRVMRMAVPAGVIIAVLTYTSYRLAYSGPDATATQTVQAGTAALITLVVIALWVLALIARPYTWWKVVLIAVMTMMCVLPLYVPFGQEFFALDPGDTAACRTGLILAVLGIVLVELSWRIAGSRAARKDSAVHPK